MKLRVPPLMFNARRVVVTEPENVGALMLGMFASIRCNASDASAAY